MNTLYLLEMGCNDNNILTDIKNHRVRVVENIDIIYNGESFNMFFEFKHGTHNYYRNTNKRTGAPLKKAVIETIKKDGLYIDTEYERENNGNGYTWTGSYRHSTLEREFYQEHLEFTRTNILKVVNRYSTKKYNKVVLIEEEAKKIINKLGGWREKDILANDPVVSIGETWNNEHKIVKVYSRRNNKLGNCCEVDLVNQKITG